MIYIQKFTLFFTLIMLFLTILSSLLFKTVYAEETKQLDLPKESVNPGSLYYPLKRLIEKGQEKLTFSQESKKTFYKTLLKKRLSELSYIVDRKYLSELESSSKRFSYQAGILAEELIKQNGVKDKEEVIKEFKQYSNFLTTLRDKYKEDSSFRMLIQHDVNTLSILSDRLR